MRNAALTAGRPLVCPAMHRLLTPWGDVEELPGEAPGQDSDSVSVTVKRGAPHTWNHPSPDRPSTAAIPKQRGDPWPDGVRTKRLNALNPQEACRALHTVCRALCTQNTSHKQLVSRASRTLGNVSLSTQPLRAPIWGVPGRHTVATAVASSTLAAGPWKGVEVAGPAAVSSRRTCAPAR